MEFHARACISSRGVHRGDYRFDDKGWLSFAHHEMVPQLTASQYIVTDLPIDFHCHGIDRFDFSELDELDLQTIDNALAAEGIRAVLTIYLPEKDLPRLCEVMADFARARAEGLYTHIVGFAIEGPVLTSPGGTPLTTIWPPTKVQWLQIAALGALGLTYVVLSPDIEVGPERDRFVGAEPLPPSVDWIVETLIDGGVRPALGHFQKGDPEGSALCTRRLIELSRRLEGGMVTDHLLNDMPRLVKHAWRTQKERESRLVDLASIDLSSWTLDNLGERLGPVPHEIVRGCLEGALTPCLNFDGEHVDLAISTRLVELLGSQNIIGMTDRIESKRLGGRALSQSTDNNLLYQSAGLVAAGTQAISRQVANGLLAGLSPQDLWNLFCFVPARVLEPSRMTAAGGGTPTQAFFVQPGSPRMVVGPHAFSAT